ncbi:MAG TPA: hypothetical protein VN671_10600 [Solirubrobacterales bacterium]|nr:hypothetical protein [Solirubrobacterales bacterium]
MRRFTVVLGLLALCSALLLAPIALAGKAKEGWGPTASWIGRYHVKVLKGGSAGVRGGELTMFLQEEFPGSEEPAGILKLRTKHNNDVVYLKELHWSGHARTAVVKGGSFLGPTIGKFTGNFKAPGKIVAGVSTKSLGSMELSLSRYSSKPTP